jgi:crotonobetainyl-CoA:carnitine CoA-transferase CaiB-like acyl-CoA transferase
MLSNAIAKRTYDAIEAALPFRLDASKVTLEPGFAYTRSPIKAHDYAAGVMAAFGSVVERLGAMRGLPAQSLKLNRRLCGLLLNGVQLSYLNGYGTLMDTWPIGPDNGVYRTKDDRWVAMIGLHPHLRDALMGYFRCANSAAAFQAAVEKKTAQQIEDEVAAINLPLGMVRSPEEWLAHPQGAETSRRPMVDIQQVGAARRRSLGPAKHRPLEGVRVVELSHLVAGPTIGRLLAEQGAEVIKIQPPLGDWIAPLWLDGNWGKKSILLDIKSRHGKARLTELLADADVLVSSQRPGALAAIGLDDAGLQSINPNLVYCAASFAVPGSPWESRRGLEQIAQAVSGVMHANSEGLDEPTYISVLINDYLTGYLGAVSAVAALAEREEKGGFWKVGASLTRCATMAASLVEPRDAEEYAPVTMQDLIDFGVDQETPSGVFTRLAPAVEFSHTPSMALRPVSWPGRDSDMTGWSETVVGNTPRALPHYPSRLAREGGIRNFVSSYGIVDRGDGRGGFSLASRELFQYVTAQRQ